MIIANDIENAGDGYDNTAPNQNVIVARDALVVGEGGVGISLAFEDSSLLVLGDVYGGLAGLDAQGHDDMVNVVGVNLAPEGAVAAFREGIDGG